MLALSIGTLKEVTPGKVDIDPIEVKAMEKAKEQQLQLYSRMGHSFLKSSSDG
ncbi:hypothetical protein [Pseudomonas sp. YuFO8]|uniref:hypothetical protein n=1 Tax=Pseudomonas sp. YuFO8 TaxID=3095361 RepID=UPI002B247952|nr:hypothetical protein [Pseudomonas sp. YuFO8]MEB2621394.1 hypothetical protein [Pseudomonas sp. YuFO8]